MIPADSPAALRRLAPGDPSTGGGLASDLWILGESADARAELAGLDAGRACSHLLAIKAPGRGPLIRMAEQALRRGVPITWIDRDPAEADALAGLARELGLGAATRRHRLDYEERGSPAAVPGGFEPVMGGSAGEIVDLLMSMNDFDEEIEQTWMPRARAMMDALLGALTELRDRHGSSLDAREIQQGFCIDSYIALAGDERLAPGRRRALRDHLESLPGYVHGARPLPELALDQHGYMQLRMAAPLSFLDHSLRLAPRGGPAQTSLADLGSASSLIHLVDLPPKHRAHLDGRMLGGAIRLGLESLAARTLDEAASGAPHVPPKRLIFARECSLPQGFHRVMALASALGVGIALEFESADSMEELLPEREGARIRRQCSTWILDKDANEALARERSLEAWPRSHGGDLLSASSCGGQLWLARDAA